MSMTKVYADNLAMLREMDPDAVVDTLGITTNDLVDELLEYIREWSEVNTMEVL